MRESRTWRVIHGWDHCLWEWFTQESLPHYMSDSHMNHCLWEWFTHESLPDYVWFTCESLFDAYESRENHSLCGSVVGMLNSPIGERTQTNEEGVYVSLYVKMGEVGGCQEWSWWQERLTPASSQNRVFSSLNTREDDGQRAQKQQCANLWRGYHRIGTWWDTWITGDCL